MKEPNDNIKSGKYIPLINWGKGKSCHRLRASHYNSLFMFHSGAGT